MSDEDERREEAETPESGDDPGEAVSGESVETGGANPEGTGSEEGEGEPVEVDPLAAMEALAAEAARWKDMALRAQADLDNFRKRMARDRQDAVRYANTGLLEGLLPILDNFEMGLEAARGESEESMIFQGMSMVKNQIDGFLGENGVTEVEAEGKAFDPNLHEAVAQEASEEVPEGQILRVMRRGFRLRDRLLRAPTVVVSNGPAGE